MQYPVKTGPIQNDAAAFSPEMVQGAIPQRQPRLPFKTQHLQPLSQTTHVSAPDTSSMWAGWHADHNRAFIPLQLSYALPPEVAAFYLEFVGYHPDSPRLQLGPRIGLPLSQTTHVNAPFSAEMVLGNHPDIKPRVQLGPKIGLPFLENIVTPFAFEMLIGWHADRPVLGPFGVQHIPPISQTTHVPSPFSVEMVEHFYPDAPKRLRPQTPGQVPLIVVTQFEFESLIGYQPNSPRILLGTRIPQPIAQTIHIVAPFSEEMVQGSTIIPAKYRPLWWPRADNIILPIVIGTPSIFNATVYASAELERTVSGSVTMSRAVTFQMVITKA